MSEPSHESSWLSIKTGATSLVAGRIATAVSGFLQVPIVLTHLGANGFGLWIALTGLLWSLAILDWGVGFAVQNKVATLLATGREAEAAALLRSAFRRLLASAVITAIVSLPLAFLGRWNAWFGVTDSAFQTQTPISLAIVFGVAAVLVPMSLALRLAAAVQQMWLTGLWAAIGSVLSLGAVALAGWLGLPLAGFVLAACLMPFTLSIGTWLHLRRRIPWLRHHPPTPNPPFGLWRESLLFFMPQLGANFIGAFVPTLVMLFAGPLGAAAFGVLQRLFGLALQVQNMALAPTWPVYTHAAALGDAAFARRTFRASWLLTTLGFVLPALLFTPVVPAIVRVWLGSDAPVITPALLWIMAGWYVLQFCGQPIATLLSGVGRIGSLALAGWVGIAGALALCAVLGPRWGAEGIVVAMAVPYAFLSLPMTAWQAWRALAALTPRPAAPL